MAAHDVDRDVAVSLDGRQAVQRGPGSQRGFRLGFDLKKWILIKFWCKKFFGIGNKKHMFKKCAHVHCIFVFSAPNSSGGGGC